jgi:hypothetical protein
MTLVLGSGQLEREIRDIVETELPTLETPVIGYVAHLFATSLSPQLWEDVRNHWIGVTHLEIPAESAERQKVLERKLTHYRRMGDKCLVISAFYREEADRTQPPIELAARLGRVGYKAAGFYATVMGQKSEPYATLDYMFLPIAVRIGPRLLKCRNPPQRIILHTPYGERVLRVRYSLS